MIIVRTKCLLELKRNGMIDYCTWVDMEDIDFLSLVIVYLFVGC